MQVNLLLDKIYSGENPSSMLDLMKIIIACDFNFFYLWELVHRVTKSVFKLSIEINSFSRIFSIFYSYIELSVLGTPRYKRTLISSKLKHFVTMMHHVIVLESVPLEEFYSTFDKIYITIYIYHKGAQTSNLISQ